MTDTTKNKSIDIEKVKYEYETNFSRYRLLEQEAKFAIQSALSEGNIKIHLIESRVKAATSLIDKCKSKGISINEIKDIVGIRVICLFSSDLDVIEEKIKNTFDCAAIDRKTDEGDGFGYLSNHYVCSIPRKFGGPRYDSIKELSFEIQTRTLCMNAWAVVSHYLDYKGDWDVPKELKRSLNALSGLFYVADNEFKLVYEARKKSIDKASEESLVNLAQNTPINLDTLIAYLDKRYPDRESPRIDPADVSKLVREMKMAGITNLRELDDLLDKHEAEFLREEEDDTPFSSEGPDLPTIYTAAGVVRRSMKLEGLFNENVTRIVKRYGENKIPKKATKLTGRGPH